MRLIVVALLTLAPVVSALGTPYPVGLQYPWPDDAGWFGACTSYVSLGELEVAFGGGVLYLDDRNEVLGNGVWIYQESNGLYHDSFYGDLQRGGASRIVPGDTEICWDVTPEGVGPDQLVF
jgi:hypothetical protein